MFYDEHYSVKNGPICSNALNGVNGVLTPPEEKEEWACNVVIVDNRTIKAAHTDESRLDRLSKSDLAILDAVWKQFGWMAPNVIRRWTHENCPEYTEVTDGRLPISYREIFVSLGYANPVEMEDRIAEHRSLEAAIARQ